MEMTAPKTLYDKIWNDHVVHEAEDEHVFYILICWFTVHPNAGRSCQLVFMQQENNRCT